MAELVASLAGIRESGLKPELTRSGGSTRTPGRHWAGRFGKAAGRDVLEPEDLPALPGRRRPGFDQCVPRDMGRAKEWSTANMKVLERLPAWTTTGVGSLPHPDARGAVEHAIDAYGLPFCPHLPRLDGDMVSEWLGADPGRCGWSPDRDRRRPAAWSLLAADLSRRPPGHGVVKLQVTGPVTLARALGAGAVDEDGLAREIATWLAANVAEQVAALAELGLDAVVVVDEPALTEAADAEVWDPLRAVAPAWGLHLCCEVPWAVVERAAPDLLSFDLTLGLGGEAGAQALGRLAGDGGMHVAWGVLAPHLPQHDGFASTLLRSAPARTGVPAERSLLSPSCGSGLVAPSREQAMAAALGALAEQLESSPAST